MTADNPKIDDVLCGRGNRHEGNGCFQMLIAEYTDTYKMVANKREKTHVIAPVVDIVVARGGRFLGQSKDGTWGQRKKKHCDLCLLHFS